jgi:molecular chaperone DnaK (HSP70)
MTENSTQPIVLENKEGKYTTTTYVAFLEQIHLGSLAKDAQPLYPQNTIYGAKRLMVVSTTKLWQSSRISHFL